jgi:hypothetical protein
MKTLFLLFILLAVITSLGFGLPPVHADNANNISIQNIAVYPSAVKVGDSFTVTATLFNNSTFPLWVDGGKCSIKDTQASFLTIVFDDHAKIKGKNVNCAGVGWSQILEPGKNLIATSPDYTVNYIATKPGTANATVIFSYHVINQTDPTQSGFGGNISKSILFTILDNETGVGNQLPIGTPFKSTLDTPLKQFKSGISAYDAKCSDGYILTIKSEDGTPACVKPTTVKILSQRGWSEIKSTQSNQDSNAKTNPFGITGLMIYYGGGPCGVGTCPLHMFNLKVNSNYTAYLLGYEICDGNSCTKRNDMSVLLPLNEIGKPNYKTIALPEDLPWKYNDTIHIQVMTSYIPDNKTTILIDLGSSRAIP